MNQGQNLIKKANLLFSDAKKLEKDFDKKVSGPVNFLNKKLTALEKEVAKGDKAIEKMEKEAANKMDKLVLGFIADLHKD